MTSARKELARAMSKRGLASRKVAAQWIIDGRVRVNNITITDPSHFVDIANDDIHVNDAKLEPLSPLYYMLNKPRGLVTTTQDEQDRETVYKCFDPPPPSWIFPVGRLDKASEGLLLFTNDTTWADTLANPASHVQKTYHVQIRPRPDASLVERLIEGITTDDGANLHAHSARILRLGEKNGWLEVTLNEGKNRQIRRMIDAAGGIVLRLIRVSIGSLQLGTLPKGAVRTLSEAEVRALTGPQA